MRGERNSSGKRSRPRSSRACLTGCPCVPRIEIKSRNKTSRPIFHPPRNDCATTFVYAARSNSDPSCIYSVPCIVVLNSLGTLKITFTCPSCSCVLIKTSLFTTCGGGTDEEQPRFFTSYILINTNAIPFACLICRSSPHDFYSFNPSSGLAQHPPSRCSFKTEDALLDGNECTKVLTILLVVTKQAAS